jgi:Arc/MetJ family transcription regulator
MGMLQSLNMLQARVNKKLRLRARDKNGGIDIKREPVELPLTEYVGERFARRPALYA